MDNKVFVQIADLTAKMKELPKGYISRKTIGGKVYYYHQWSENGVKQSRYIKDDEVKELADLIEKRKIVQTQINVLKGQKENKQNNTGIMKCVLMHKKTPVVSLELDGETGYIQKIDEVYATNHLPIGIHIRHGIIDRTALNEWWADRSIPASRSGIREALEILELSNTRLLLLRCYGLSLSDQYWIKPDGSDLCWENINFFCNPFSNDVGDVLFGVPKKMGEFNFFSPDNTSDGFLKKRWKIIDGKRYLIKGGSNPFQQQPFNEVIASKIMDRLGIPHVSYSLVWNDGVPYSVCEDFVDENTELIPAWRIMMSQKKSNSTSVYQHFVNCCEALEIKGTTDFLDRMITLDYIIGNEDRHFNNFGALRNAETLEWIGMAPIYDSGSSLGYDKLPTQIRSGNNIECKPFKNHYEEQIKLVRSFSWLDLSKLNDVDQIIKDVFSQDKDGTYIDDNRVSAIIYSVEQRIKNLEQLINERRTSSFRTDSTSTEDDVKKDIAKII